MSQSAAQAVPKLVDNEVSPYPYRILIADDCPDIQHSMAFRFNNPFLHIEFANDGRECVDMALAAKAQGYPYDVIIVDVLMPVLDGFSTAMLLNENKCCRKLLSMTERGMFCDESESIQAGCNRHFKKHELYTELIPYLEQELGFDSRVAYSQ